MIFTDKAIFTDAGNIPSRGMSLAEFAEMVGISENVGSSKQVPTESEYDECTSPPDESDDYASESVDCESATGVVTGVVDPVSNYQQPDALAGNPIPRIYVSGPMSGIKGFNFDAFFEAAERLRAKGHDVVNPAELDDGNTSMPWNHYLRRDLLLMLDCEAVALLPGWEGSMGARLERYVARRLWMPCKPLEDWCSRD